jgi:hypothetical protein
MLCACLTHLIPFDFFTLQMIFYSMPTNYEHLLLLLFGLLFFLPPVTNSNTSTILPKTIHLCSSVHMNEDEIKISINISIKISTYIRC